MMRTERRRLRLWGRAGPLALMAGVLLGACGVDGGEGEPTSPPTEATTEPSTQEPTEPSPEPEPWPEPTRPPQMDRDDVEGAEAAAVYFMELYQYMYATGDVAAWQEMSLESCNFCRASADHVLELLDAGGSSSGGSFAVDEVLAFDPDSEFDYFRIVLSGVEEPSVERSVDGETLLTTSGGAVKYHFAVHRSDDAWQIGGVSVEGGDG